MNMPKLKKRLFNRVAIIGLGLMGASLGLALKKGKIANTVAGFARRPATRKKALKRKVVDIVCGRIEDAVKCADLAVICAPVGIITGLAKQCLQFAPDNAVITDVGSAKARIAADMEKTFAGKQVNFVGSHPIAGSEQHGLESARADLYRGAVVALTPTPRTSKKALRVASKFWRALGAQLVVISPRAHDRIIARTSHLPHIIAALLAACVGRERAGDYAEFCGTGFRDTTRVAEGDPGLWRDILENNAHNLKFELSVFEKELKKILSGLRKGRHGVVGKCLKNGRDRRRKLLAARI
jgi:prephenate dehydrogenase